MKATSKWFKTFIWRTLISLLNFAVVRDAAGHPRPQFDWVDPIVMKSTKPLSVIRSEGGMLMRQFVTCLTVLVALASFAGQASAVTISFEEFNVGDGLSEVNAVTAPLGITFDAAFPATFEVVLDPGTPATR